MHIKISSLGKRFGPQWIIRDFNYDFKLGVKYALRGSNGSGKSTLLQLCSTYLEPTKGKIEYFQEAGLQISSDHIYKYFSFAAPYLSLVPHFSIIELLDFHEKLKGWKKNYSSSELLHIMELDEHKDKYIQALSSGMRQRVRLIVSMYAKSPVVFLDEPTTNLDEKGKSWFQEQLTELGTQKVVIIASNEEEDLKQCTESIMVENYK